MSKPRHGTIRHTMPVWVAGLLTILVLTACDGGSHYMTAPSKCPSTPTDSCAVADSTIVHHHDHGHHHCNKGDEG